MSPRTEEDHIECPKPNKKARIETDGLHLPASLQVCRILLKTHETLAPSIPGTLSKSGKTGNNVHKLRSILDRHGFRTSVIASPREGLSVYKDSAHLNEEDLEEEFLPGRLFLVTLFGLHPQQRDLERLYTSHFKNLYCLLLFCKRIREACPNAEKETVVEHLLSENEQLYAIFHSGDPDTLKKAISLSSSVSERIRNLIHVVNQTEPSNRVEQLEHEYQRIVARNSTLSNALVTMFLWEHACCIKDIIFKSSHQSKYERITIYLYDTELDHHKPPHFLFLPSIHEAMEGGPKAVVEEMLQSFWLHMLRHGYFATPALKSILKDDLARFFLSGITSDVRIPLQL
jgi:hypothetical protein